MTKLGRPLEAVKKTETRFTFGRVLVFSQPLRPTPSFQTTQLIFESDPILLDLL